jgi:hypothetical protein
VHPGYYWLTYTWENLLLSCAACNKKLSDKPTWTDPTTGPAAGKLDRFPLQDEHQRAMDPSFDLSLQPLLIDPTRLDPEDHITFDLIGEAVTTGMSLSELAYAGTARAIRRDPASFGLVF